MFSLHYDWTKYGHGCLGRIAAGPMVIDIDIWVDSWTKGRADASFKQLQASVDVNFPGKGEWCALSALLQAKLV